MNIQRVVRTCAVISAVSALLLSAGCSWLNPEQITLPTPTVRSLSPTFAVAGSGPQTLTINGSNFVQASTATFNGVVHEATFENSTQLKITLSQSDLASVGSVAVAVTNPHPGGGTSANAAFQITEAA